MNKNKEKVVIGNLKMNGSLSFYESYLNTLKDGLCDLNTIDIGLCVPYPYLAQAQHILNGSNISWGSQNIAKFKDGPHTGEVSALMLNDFGVQYVIVGHSERSTAYCESNENIADKFNAVKKYNMTPVLCVGENLIEREAGIMEKVVASQIETIIKCYGAEIFSNSIIAYEPIWAIGTDMAASPEQTNHMCNYIRELINQDELNEINNLKIVYGGSLNAENAVQLFGLESVDGGLIGRAAINSEEFIRICRCVQSFES